MKIMRDIVLKKDFQKLWGEPLGVKVKYFWRKSWNDIPDIMALMPLFFVGVGMLGWSIYKTDAIGTPKYYMETTIYRPDDPRVATIRKDETLQPGKPMTYLTDF